MARLANNTGYLTIGGTDVGADVIEVELSGSANANEITAGFDKTHVERDPGLKDTSISISLAYDIATVDTVLPKIQAGQTTTIVYGPEGNTANDPKHEQDFVLTQVTGPKKMVSKDLVVFQVQGQGARVPVTDMYNGGTF